MTTEEDEEHRFYDVDKFKEVVEKQVPPASRAGRFVRRVRNQFDSFAGFLSTSFAMVLVFVAPLFVVTMALLYRLPGFVLAYAVTAGGFSLYIKRKMGKSLQFAEGSLRTKLLGSIIGYSIVVAVFYFVFYIILGRKLS